MSGNPLTYLRLRVDAVTAASGSNRPRWSRDDIEAVEALLRAPAASEQIALARIEGIASFASDYSPGEMRGIVAIARKALRIS